MSAPSPVSSGLAFGIIPVTVFQQNCTVVWCTATKRAAVIDPGGSVDLILSAVKGEGLELEAIWLTHGHLDHAGGVAEMMEKTGLPVIGPHREDEFLIQNMPAQAAKYGLQGGFQPFAPTRWLEDGDRLTLGETEWEVYHTPGHTPGHVIFFNRAERFAQVGDVLFNGGVGRTDFPRSDSQALIDSITDKLWPLGDDVRFIPGHGPGSTFGNERRTNPFVSDSVLGRAA